MFTGWTCAIGLHNLLVSAAASTILPLVLALLIQPTLDCRRLEQTIVPRAMPILSMTGLLVLMGVVTAMAVRQRAIDPAIGMFVGCAFMWAVWHVLSLLTYRLQFDGAGITQRWFWRTRRLAWADIDARAAEVWRENCNREKLLTALTFRAKRLWLWRMRASIFMTDAFEAAVRDRLKAPAPASRVFSRSWRR
jgi:hypothetical protein